MWGHAHRETCAAEETNPPKTNLHRKQLPEKIPPKEQGHVKSCSNGHCQPAPHLIDVLEKEGEADPQDNNQH